MGVKLSPMRFYFNAFRSRVNSRVFFLKGLRITPFLLTPIVPLSMQWFRGPLLNNSTALIPDKKGDTFEMGLYISSQKQLQEEAEKERERIITTSVMPSFFKRILYRINDVIIEPVLTLLRFLELSSIFIPLLIIYPITCLGHHKTLKVDSNRVVKETSGSLLWFKLLRKALEFAGPTFIKLGQWAGSRTDIFSEGLCAELGRLHSNAKPHALKFTKEAIVNSLDRKYEFDDIFDEFNEKPVGCGAIAQVYIGKLTELMMKNFDIKTDSRYFAVKVVHPNVPKKIDRDLKIMTFFADMIDSVPTMEWLSLPNEVEQFSILMKLQLDLRIECQNLQKFNDNFADNPRVKFPVGAMDLSSRYVLFEEYIHGFPMEKFLSSKDGLKRVDLCRKVSDPFIEAFLKMLILDDFIFADLHPGNVMIRFMKLNKQETKVVSSEKEMFQIVHKLRAMSRDNDPEFIPEMKRVFEEYEPQVCLIDAGLVTELNDRNRVNFIALFNALAKFDGYRAGELMIERSRTPETAIDKDLFALKVEKLVNKVKKQTFTLGTVSIGELLDKMLGMVRQHHVRMEGDFVSVIVAILLLEGIGRQLDPEMDLFARFVLFVLMNGFSST